MRRRSILLAAALLACGVGQADDKKEDRVVVDKARLAFGYVVKTQEYDSLRAGLNQAKGVLIYPQVLKAGLFLGGSGGTGVLVVRGTNNDWSQPAANMTVDFVSYARPRAPSWA